MKKLFVMFGLVLMMNANAQSTQSKKYSHPSGDEISRNRACFKELEEVQGCRPQEEDPAQFKECISIAVDALDEHCKTLVLKLYGE